MPFRSAEAWREARSFHHSRYTPELLRSRSRSISVCLPARNCAATVGPIVAELARMRAGELIDEIVVIDGNSDDDTVAIAAGAGASVYGESELMADLGPVLGKGDAMWRALSVLEGEVVCFLDADLAGFSTHYVTGLVGPLLELEDVEFVKAFYRRPFRVGDVALADGGGRVNHLLARPALAIFFPSWRGSISRSRGRSRRAARSSSESRSRPATASRSRCCSTPTRRLDSREWRRSTSTCTTTATSRFSR